MNHRYTPLNLLIAHLMNDLLADFMIFISFVIEPELIKLNYTFFCLIPCFLLAHPLIYKFLTDILRVFNETILETFSLFATEQFYKNSYDYFSIFAFALKIYVCEHFGYLVYLIHCLYNY